MALFEFGRRKSWWVYTASVTCVVMLVSLGVVLFTFDFHSNYYYYYVHI